LQTVRFAIPVKADEKLEGTGSRPPAPPASPPAVPTRWFRSAAVVFPVAASIFAAVFARFPVLYDVDGYYHLAVARAYAERGVFTTLEWARFSIMHDGFGDKEFLFHVLLVPFVTLGDPSRGGLLALAVFNAAVATVLAHAGLRAIGRWGFVVPLLVYATSMDFALRMVRLRPELLSLLLLLIAVHLAGTRRMKLLGLVAFLYALSYTAFQAFFGLCLVFFLSQLLARGERDWRIISYPALGIALGLVINPHFPSNIQVWLVQNFHYYLNMEALDVGNEIEPRTTKDMLLLNLGWLIALLLFWRARFLVSEPRGETRLRDFTVLAALAFGLLYVLMARFVTYFVPLATLALLRHMQAVGAAPGPSLRLPWRGRIPFAPTLAVCILLSAYSTLHFGFYRMQRSSRDFRPEMRADWEAFAKAMPAGAKVLAPWSATHEFVFWAPSAAYVNVLDPVFMFARDADSYRLFMDILQGLEPDIPLAAVSRFDSDFYADDGQTPFARIRLRNDPRVARLHDGMTYLYRFLEGKNGAFLLDWKVFPQNIPMPPSADRIADAKTLDYPRARSERERAIEGYVDGRRFGFASRCLGFARIIEVDRPREMKLEIAPYGRSQVFLDDRLMLSIPADRGAVLGRGVFLALRLTSGQHRLSIRTCAANRNIGFYALIRE
jgi:hypothetical protein